MRINLHSATGNNLYHMYRAHVKERAILTQSRAPRSERAAILADWLSTQQIPGVTVVYRAPTPVELENGLFWTVSELNIPEHLTSLFLLKYGCTAVGYS